MDSQEILDKKWFYVRGRVCPIIHKCIMEHEHNGISWPATLALMVKYLSEANEIKDHKIRDMLTYYCRPPMGS